MAGDAVESLSCALILKANPCGNRVTPSRGHRGVDFRIFNGTGWDVYQVKRYAATLTSGQKAEIERSWATFVDEILPFLRVDSYNLVLPWDPTWEQTEWFVNLTSTSGIVVNWIGLAQLDRLAAEAPQVVDYFHGDGAHRIHELLRDAIASGKELPNDANGATLLTAGIERHQLLSRTLDQIDPLYRYTFEVRPGPVPTDVLGAIAAGMIDALTTFQQLSDTEHVVIRIAPRYAWSTVLRPITRTLQFTAADGDQQDQLDAFVRYGAPLDNFRARTVASDGPPGTTAEPDSQALVSFVPTPRGDFPDLELRVREHDQVVCSVPLTDVQISVGLDHHGMRIAARDRSGCLQIEARMSSPGVREHLNLRTEGLPGTPVRRVQPATAFAAALTAGRKLEIAIEGGLSVGGTWDVPVTDNDMYRSWAALVDDLVVIQAHTATVVRVPSHWSAQEAAEVKRVAALLRGTTLPAVAERVALADEAPVPAGQGELRAVRFHRPLIVDVGGQEIETDRLELVYCRESHFEVDVAGSHGPPGQAWIVFDAQPVVLAVPQSFVDADADADADTEADAEADAPADD